MTLIHASLILAENESSNAKIDRRNRTQNAHSPPLRSPTKLINEKLQKLRENPSDDMGVFTDNLLSTLKQQRETILSSTGTAHT